MARLPDSPFVYPILDLSLLRERTPEAAASALVAGGALLVQVRGKDVGDADLLDAVRRALPVVRAAGGVLIVNDRADVALIAGADGVHVGQDDLPPAECRRLLGPHALIGWSTHELVQVRQAAEQPVDYVAFGPVFATASKPGADPVVGLEGLRDARRATTLPLVAIGGITRARAASVVAAGADGLAAIGDLMGDPDTARAVREMRAAIGPPPDANAWRGPARVSAALSLVCPACRAPLAPAGAWSCGACGASYVERDGILHLVAGREGAPGYDPHYFEALPAVEGRHFWFLARREVILDGIRRGIPDWRQRPLFDIGCGTGGLLAYLASEGVPLAGACDAYLRALEVARGRVGAPLLMVDEGRPPALGPGQRFLGLFDVLEHIDDDAATLAWLHSVLEPGGYLALTVPAHPFLFGETDRLACHRRRYRRRELDERLRQAGFEVRRLTHFMAPLVPLLALTRHLGGGSSRVARKDAELRLVPVVNGALRALLKLELLALRAVSLPFGSSLLAIARRPA